MRRLLPTRPLALSVFAVLSVLAGAAGTWWGLLPAPTVDAAPASAGAPTNHPVTADAPAVRSCQATNLRLVPGIIRGAPHGDLTIGLAVRNVSRTPCRIATPPATTSIVAAASGPPLATTEGGGTADLTLGSGGSARTSVRWSNWCGGPLTQWGVRLRFAGQQRSVYALVINNVAAGSMGSVIPPVPSCHHGGHSRAAIAPFVLN